MRESIYLALAFLATLFLALCFVPSLPYPLAYTPLIFITGLLVMHRTGVAPGLAWLFLGSLLLATDHVAIASFWPQFFALLAAGLLASRVFASRSVYALMGLGLITGAVLLLFTLLQALATLIFSGGTASVSLSGAQLWSFL